MARSTVKKLTLTEINRCLKKLPDWEMSGKGTEISTTIHTNTFLSGLALIARVTVHAEILEHHPIIELSYNKVKIRISTHEVKCLTKIDFELAKRISNIVD